MLSAPYRARGLAPDDQQDEIKGKEIDTNSAACSLEEAVIDLSTYQSIIFSIFLSCEFYPFHRTLYILESRAFDLLCLHCRIPFVLTVPLIVTHPCSDLLLPISSL